TSLERFDVILGNDPAARDQDVIPALCAHQLLDAGNQCHVRSTQDGKTDDVDVFLDRGGRDHLRRLVKAGVNDLHSSITKRGGDDFCATIVAIQTRFCDEYPNSCQPARTFQRSTLKCTLRTSSRLCTTALL